MLNFKPRLLHAAMLLALPTLLAGYPQENAFAQTVDASATGNGLMNRPVLKWIKKRFNKPAAAPLALTEPTIWLAQTHIQLLNHPEPHKVVSYTGDFDPDLKFAEDKLNKYLGTTGEKMLKLAGGRDTLVKLDISPAVNFSNPDVKATLYNKSGAVVWEGSATKPAVAPTSFEYNPGTVNHTLDQSFRLMLPGQYLATGTQLQIVVQDPNPAKRTPWVERFQLNVGAPTVFPVTMFDFRLFGGDGRTLPSDAMHELGRKLLIKKLDLQRVEVNMDQAVFFPIGNVPHILASSFTDWQTKAQSYSGTTQQAQNPHGVNHSQTILKAMRDAGGQKYISAYHGNFNDGTRFGFDGEGDSSMTSSSTNASVADARGVFAHEFSHNLDLYHWHERNAGKTYADKQYPYDGDMFGISQPTAPNNKTHNGPTWHYKLPATGVGFGVAIAPFKVDTSNGNKIYKRVISTARAQDDIEQGEQIGVFSDFDNRVSQHWLESVLRVYNTQTGKWSTWDQATGGYNKPAGGTAGFTMPRQAAPESVLSLVFATSVVNKAVNLAYRPVGPYNSGILNLYDPQNATQRTQAKDRAYCPAATLPSGGGCDYSVKVVQGGVTRVYMLPIDDESNNLQRNIALTSEDAVKHVAINVPASGGSVTEMTIYKTPNVERATTFSIQSAEMLSTRQF